MRGSCSSSPTSMCSMRWWQSYLNRTIRNIAMETGRSRRPVVGEKSRLGRGVLIFHIPPFPSFSHLFLGIQRLLFGGELTHSWYCKPLGRWMRFAAARITWADTSQTHLGSISALNTTSRSITSSTAYILTRPVGVGELLVEYGMIIPILSIILSQYGMIIIPNIINLSSTNKRPLGATRWMFLALF